MGSVVVSELPGERKMRNLHRAALQGRCWFPACNVTSLTQLRSVARRRASFIFGVLIDAMTRNPGLGSIKGVCVNALSNWG